MKKFNYLSVVATLILVALIYMIYVFFNPLDVWQQSTNRSIVTKVAEEIKVPVSSFQQMVEIGVTEGFKDMDALRKESKFNEQVYKDAKKGDKAILYQTKMAIYRGGKVLYQGMTPAQLQAQEQQSLVTEADKKLKSDAQVQANESPQVAVVQDKEKLKDNPFYEKAATGDLVLVYTQSRLGVLVSSTSGQILNTIDISATPATQAPAPSAAPAR